MCVAGLLSPHGMSNEARQMRAAEEQRVRDDPPREVCFVFQRFNADKLNVLNQTALRRLLRLLDP